MIWLNGSIQISKLTDDLVVIADSVVVAVVIESNVASSNSVGVVAVIVAVVDVVVVVVAIVSGMDVNESNAMIQLDKSIVRVVFAGEFGGCVVTMPDVEVKLIPVGAIAVAPFCNGMAILDNCNIVYSCVGDEMDVLSKCKVITLFGWQWAPLNGIPCNRCTNWFDGGSK